MKSSEQPAHDKCLVCVCCLLLLLSLLLLVLAQGREWCRHIQVRRSQKEKVGSVSSSVPHSLLPSCSFDHENIHLHPRNHGSMGHFGNTGSGGFDGFVQIQNPSSRPQCRQTFSVECHWCQSWKGLQQAATQAVWFQASRGGQFYLDQSRRGDLFPTSLEMK